MTKKKRNTKLAIKDILKGKFLIEENATNNWKFILYLIFLAFFIIASTHSLENKVVKLNNLKEDIDQEKAKYTSVNSRMMQLQLESQLVYQMQADSLFSLETHPIKIVIESNGK